VILCRRHSRMVGGDVGEYIEKPPVVQAVYWDGSREGVEQILDILRKTGETFSYRYMVRYINSMEPSAELEIESRGLIPGKQPGGAVFYLRPDSWFICRPAYSSEPRIDAMHRIQFKERFRKVEDGTAEAQD
jgi:hypothetical protein